MFHKLVCETQGVCNVLLLYIDLRPDRAVKLGNAPM